MPAVAVVCGIDDGAPALEVAAAPEIAGTSTPPAEGWVDVELPDSWHTRWPAADTVWYRIRWSPECADVDALAVAVKSVSMAGSIHLNDNLLWRDVRLEEPLSRSWNFPRYWLLPQAALDGVGDTLWVRVTGMRHDNLGLGQVALGEAAAVWRLHQRQSWQHRHLFTLNACISLVLGCLFLVLWMAQRSEVAFGWYALASLAWAGFAATMLATSPWPLADSASWNRFVVSLFVLYCMGFCQFTWSFGRQQWPRLARALWWVSGGALLVLWTVPLDLLNPALIGVGLGYTAIFLANCAQFQCHAWRDRRRHTMLLALCLLFFLVVCVHDLLVILELVPGSGLYAPYTSPVSMLFMSLIVADRFAANLRRTKSFNIELRAAVEDTRTELTRTLQREHQLEVRNIRLIERLKLSHDLHDSLGNSLMRSIAAVELSAVAPSRARFLSMLKELRDDLRQIIDNSSPTATSENTTPAEWIAPLRHRFVRLFDELGITSQWRIPPAWPCRLSSMQLLALTRFIEEALTNAIKHSGGRRMEVGLWSGPDGLTLEVVDDGVGFDVDAVLDGPGIGMSSMRARIARIHGRLDIRSRAGETRLRVSLHQPGAGSLQEG